MSEAQIKTATELVRGSRVVEVLGAYNPEISDLVLEPMTLPEPRLLSDYTTAPCKHECISIKELRHAKQAHRLIVIINPDKQTHLPVTAGQCGMDSAHCHSAIVKEVVKLDRTGGMEGRSREATLFCAATLHGFGLPVDYAKMKSETIPESCACCKAPL